MSGTIRSEGAKKSVVAVVGIAFAVAAAVGGGLFYKHIKELKEMEELFALNTIYSGVKIQGVDVSNKTTEQAAEIIKQKFNDVIDGQEVGVKYNDKRWSIPFKDVEAGYDIESAVNAAYQMGRSGEGKQRYESIKRIAAEGAEAPLDYSYNAEKLNEAIAKIAEEINAEPKDAELSRENGKFAVTEERVGYKMNNESAAARAAEIIESKTSGVFEPEVETISPSLTKEQALQATTLIGSFSTSYTGANNGLGRNENLRLGCYNINGTIVKPGEVFSANEALGPQTAEAGYKNAAVYSNGKVEQDIAGGVCQVTTTLYNAVIFAELEIVERSAHSLTVGYVPLGRDAAVAGDYKDLKFKNDTDYPVYVEMYLANNKVVANIYGREIHNEGRSLEFETVYDASVPKPAEKVSKNPNLPKGERKVVSAGKTGHKVSVYKKVFENGKLQSRDLFSKSSYMSTADEVQIGTGESAPDAEQPQTAPETQPQPQPVIVDVDPT